MDNPPARPILASMTYDADVLIVGGGLNGPALALALAQGGLSAILCDALPKEVRADPQFDGRAYALSLTSRRMLEALDVWPSVAAHAQPVREIVVTDAKLDAPPSQLFLHFDHEELDQGPASQILEDRFLRPVLLRMLEETEGVEHRAPVRVVVTRMDAAGAEAELEDGTVLRARVLIACDGRDSPVAARAGIRRTGWDYGQTGLVCAIEHELPHHGVAYQQFLPGGPFAVLPLPGNRSSLVWSERRAEAERIAALPHDAYLEEVRRRLGDFLGEIRLAGKRFAYPLKLSLANAYVAPRLALVGDAAHGVHPIAGQGLNLGLRDAAALAEVLTDAARRGEDIGAVDILERYQRWRRFDDTAAAFGFDLVNRAFSNDFAPLRPLRDAALALAGAAKPLRRAFMRQAAGLTGQLPRLMEGRRL